MDGKGYLLPETIDPEAYTCIKVYVPTDTLYIAAFWRAYEFFCSWLAWQRDTLQSGKAAAAVWRVGFDMARELWEAGDTCGMEIQLRQNPADACELQQSHDGGETWTLAFDYRLCSSGVTVPPPYTGEPDAPGDAAAAVMRNVWQELVNLAEAYCGLTRAEYVLAATAYMRTFQADYAAPAALGAIYDAYCVMTPEDQEEARSECPLELKKTEASACFDIDGALDYLDCWAEQIGAWLNETNTALMQALNQAAAALSGNGVQNASAGGAGGGAGFGGDCATLSTCYEFTSANNSFVANAGEGTWINGTGWKAQLNGGGTLYILDMARTGGFPSGIIEDMRLDWEPTGNGKVMRVYVNGALKAEVLGGSAGFRTLTFPVNTAVSTVRVYLEQNTLNANLRAIRLCFYRT